MKKKKNLLALYKTYVYSRLKFESRVYETFTFYFSRPTEGGRKIY